MYRVSIKGNIKKEVTNDAENYGQEGITSDEKAIHIVDFGNNYHKHKNLRIVKIAGN